MNPGSEKLKTHPGRLWIGDVASPDSVTLSRMDATLCPASFLLQKNKKLPKPVLDLTPSTSTYELKSRKFDETIVQKHQEIIAETVWVVCCLLGFFYLTFPVLFIRWKENFILLYCNSCALGL